MSPRSGYSTILAQLWPLEGFLFKLSACLLVFLFCATLSYGREVKGELAFVKLSPRGDYTILGKDVPGKGTSLEMFSKGKTAVISADYCKGFSFIGDHAVAFMAGKEKSLSLVLFDLSSKKVLARADDVISYQKIGEAGVAATTSKRNGQKVAASILLSLGAGGNARAFADTLGQYAVTADSKSVIYLKYSSENQKNIYKVDVSSLKSELAGVLPTAIRSIYSISATNELLLEPLKNDAKPAIVTYNTITKQSDRVEVPSGYSIFKATPPCFTANGKSIVAYLQEKPAGAIKTDSTSGIELWGWKDIELVSVQNKKAQRSQIEKKLWISRDRKTLTPLENDTLCSLRPVGDGSKYMVGVVDYPYLLQRSWQSGKIADYYLVNVETGGAKLVVKSAPYYVNSSPSGKYLYWVGSDSLWYSYSLSNGTILPFTKGIPDSFFDIASDEPSVKSQYAPEGWVSDDKVLLKSYYDLWICDLSGREAPISVTHQQGKQSNAQYRVASGEKEFLNSRKEVVAERFNLSTKESGLYMVDVAGKKSPKALVSGGYKFTAVQYAAPLGVLAWRQESYSDYPNAWVKYGSDRPKRITNISTSDSLRGSAHLLTWENKDFGTLQGMLFLPDSTRFTPPYPCVVNFYEQQSNDINLYRELALSDCNINVPYYVENGFAVFIPDIKFRVGDPGESSYSCMKSALEHLAKRYPQVDMEHLGIQGHSWGAFQTVYLLTRMNCFKAAVAMAPVVNMIGGYGSLRRGVGSSRMFQYESGQSRIGSTLWDNPQAYIKHSSILYADRITAPLLVIANDNDGSVPYEQGMEIFLGMRRLQKPCWMVNYKGDAHVLNIQHNKKDYTEKMMGIFRFYLKGKEKPDWMM
jgi:dipeptidyl aminopeptidase/acylaminoacyl peptidase